MKKEFEEQFNKLSQLDRIEYRQKEDRIREKFGMRFWKVFNMSFITLGFFIILDLVFYLSDKVILFSIPNLKTFAIVFLVLLVISSVVDIINICLEEVAIKKLNSEYFKIVKKK